MKRACDPMTVFWRDLSGRYLILARTLYRQCSWNLEDDYSDLAQDTLLLTQKFVEERQALCGPEFRFDEDLINECLAHAKTCMRRDFIDRVRKAIVRSRYRSSYYGDDESVLPSVHAIIDHRDYPGEHMVIMSWIAEMRSRTRSPFVQELLTEMAKFASENSPLLPSFSFEEVVERMKGQGKNVSYNAIYKYKRLVVKSFDDASEEGRD